MMANKPIEMRKVRELLRLKFEQGQSGRTAAKMLGIGKSTALDYIAGFNACGLDIKAIAHISDGELINLLTIKKQTTNSRFQVLSNKFQYFEKELNRKGVTLQLLWEEYKEDYEEHYSYSQFCQHYYNWRKESKVSMRMTHKAGDKLYVDFTGYKQSYTCPKTGEIIECEVFVAVLGASQMSYIEAVPTQTKEDWIAVNENALRFYGGSPAAIVPDCLKSAVIKADKYVPTINQSYSDFAAHYNTTILPARALHPQDKSLAENFVRNAYRQIYAPLRNRIFFSLEELNHALCEQLDVYNKKPFQKKTHSRAELFNEIEKPELKQLPTNYYDFKNFKMCKVQYNHHIYLSDDQHYYSVPFLLTGKKVLVTFTSAHVEIYHNNIRVAFHKRDRTKYNYTTNKDHRPENHQYVSDWSPARFKNWARSISPQTEQVVISIMDSKEHPEQAYKSCMGLLNLSKKYDKDDYIKACNKALKLQCCSYKFVKNVLQTKTFNLSKDEELNLFSSLPEHKNIRGKAEYN